MMDYLITNKLKRKMLNPHKRVIKSSGIDGIQQFRWIKSTYQEVTVTGTHYTSMSSYTNEIDCSNVGFTEIPDLSHINGLNILNCSFNKLTQLPELPSILNNLNCSNNSLMVLPNFQRSLHLTELNCSHNLLVELPDLSKLGYDVEYLKIFLNRVNTNYGLTTLDCSYNYLTVINELPNGLRLFDCRFNQIEQLPELPDKLTHLTCCDNELVYLPEIPDNLVCLDCKNNKINQLPELNNIGWLDCQNNNINQLPELKYLRSLKCQNNNLYKLPELPEQLNYLSISYNPLIELPKLPKVFYEQGIIECSVEQLNLIPVDFPKKQLKISLSKNLTINGKDFIDLTY